MCGSLMENSRGTRTPTRYHRLVCIQGYDVNPSTSMHAPLLCPSRRTYGIVPLLECATDPNRRGGGSGWVGGGGGGRKVFVGKNCDGAARRGKNMRSG